MKAREIEIGIPVPDDLNPVYVTIRKMEAGQSLFIEATVREIANIRCFMSDLSRHDRGRLKGAYITKTNSEGVRIWRVKGKNEAD